MMTTSSSSTKRIALPAMMSSVVASAVANTIIRRIALVPMQRYPYFLTQLQTLTYVVFYSSMLWWRYNQQGIVSNEMLQIRKFPFVVIGLWDAIGDILGNVGTSRLPGYQVPLLAKLNIVFTAIFSFGILGKRYSWYQVCSMSVVLCGSIITLIPSLFFADNQDENENGSSFSNLFYAGIYVASVAPTALAFVLKEQVFAENAHLNLDIFVVNTYGSIVGLFFTILLIPLAAVPGLGKVESLSDLPSYMIQGAQCFMGHSNSVQVEDNYSCNGSPLAPLLYFAINLTYNIAFLNLIKHGGALLTFITNTVTFPLSTILFTLDWPLLGSSTLNVYVIVGLLVELTGIVFYQQASSAVVVMQKQKQQANVNAETSALVSTKGKEKNSDYGGVINTDDRTTDSESESDQDYLQCEPPLCYNKALRTSFQSSCCNKEELCKCLLSPKCNCG